MSQQAVAQGKSGGLGLGTAMMAFLNPPGTSQVERDYSH